MNLHTEVKLKNYIFFREVEDGVLFESGQRNFVLKGKGIYPVVARVIRFLDTGIEAANMLRQLPEKVAPFAQRLLEELNRHGMLLNATAERELLNRFQAQGQQLEFLRFLQDNLDDDYATAFYRWQNSEILLLGNGYALKSALGCLVNSGVGAITLGCLGQSHIYPTDAEMSACIAQREQQDPDFRCLRVTQENLQQLRAGPPRMTLVCADDLPGLQAVLSSDLHSVLCNTPYMVASSLGGNGFVSPLMEQGYTDFSDVREWLVPAEIDVGKIPSPETEQGLSPAAYALTGALGAYNFLKHCFAIDKVFLRNHCALVSPFLDVDYHPVLPVQNLERTAPLLPVEYKVPFEVPEGRPVSRYETLLMNLAPVFDRLLGPFSPEPAKKLKQLPLYHDAIQVRFPQNCGVAPQVVYGWGVSAEDAGLRTLALALALYAKVQNRADPKGVVAAFDHASWVQQATALAVINAPDFAKNSARAYLYPDELDHTNIQMLVRILRLYVAGPVRVNLYWQDGAGAFAARFDSPTGVTGLGYSATPDQAVFECLGSACSAYQFPELPQLAEIDRVRQLPAAELKLDPSVLRDYGEYRSPQLIVTEQVMNNLFNTDAYIVGSVAVARKNP